MPTSPRPHPLWWPTLADAADTLVALAATAAGLGVAIALVDGVHATSVASVLLATLVVGAGDLVLRAPLRLLAHASGAVGALVVGLSAQVLVAWFALAVIPGIDVDSGWSVVLVLLLAAVVMAVGRWVWGVNDSEYVLGDVLRRARSRARRAGVVPTAPGVVGGREPGLLVVQLDGVGARVLELAVEAGLAPTMARWTATGSHRLDRWWASVPASTPASQAGLLHGDASGIPAFRWWDRELGRLVVTNHPGDAALVEAGLSDGAGLLAPGGTAISTMFTGDAATSLLVMSRSLRGPDGGRGGIGPGAEFLRFFASPFVLGRAVVLSAAEIVKELYQGRRQRVRGVEPRISRRGWYVVLRAVTNVLLRDLNTSLVAEHLVRGTPVVFVDLLDYDEIAHHAGPTRPESLRALEGLDRVLGLIERVLPVAGRDYRVVVLSDHGQTLGPTFEQREGRSLLEVVRGLMQQPGPGSAAPTGAAPTGADTTGAATTGAGAAHDGGAVDDGGAADAVQADAGEDWGPLNALLTLMFAGPHAGGGALVGPDASGRSARGPARAAAGTLPPAAGASPPEVVVGASGNLALVWFPREPERLVLEDVQLRWPGLVAGLAARPAIGVVVVDTAERGLAAIGPRGIVLLEQDVPPEGEDPLAGYGTRARADLARAGRLAHTGDLLIVSAVTPDGQVHAFEGQVGSHGGLGGDQNVALLLHPTELTVDDDLVEPVDGAAMLVGSERVHAQLLRWTAALGLRP